MKIESIGVRIPTRIVTNDDVLELLQEHSPEASALLVKTYQRIVRGLFSAAGCQLRHVRDEEKGEKASDVHHRGHQRRPGKGEPETGGHRPPHLLRRGQGIPGAGERLFLRAEAGDDGSCFDIVDACMSWIRALEISYEFFKSGRYKHIMIANGEFNIYHGFPDNFKIRDLRQVEYTFPTYTIGEAASATILSPSDHEWKFAYKSLPELADLCTIPLDGYDNFVEPSKRLGRNGLYNFVSYGRELFDAARKYLAPLVKELVEDLNEPDIYFPHAASDAAYLAASKDHSLPLEKMFAEVFPNYGNIVSASIPVGMDMALKSGRLQRGNKVVFCPASAGMVYSAVQFVF